MKVVDAQKQIKIFKNISLIVGILILFFGGIMLFTGIFSLMNPQEFAQEVEASAEEIGKFSIPSIVVGGLIMLLGLFHILNWFNLGKITKDVTKYKPAFITSSISLVIAILTFAYSMLNAKSFNMGTFFPVLLNAYIFYLVFVVRRSLVE